MASDASLSCEMALRWALNAKNSLENCHGFTPYQLHIGRNPVMPSVTRDGPPSYESITKSESFAKNLNAMHSARQEFTHAESSAILKKALKSRVYPRGENIIKGDWIYYKKNDSKSKSVLWNGPSQVTAINGKKLFIDRGARLATVNRDDAVRVGEEFWRADDLDKGEDKNTEKGNSAVGKVNDMNDESSEESSDEETSSGAVSGTVGVEIQEEMKDGEATVETDEDKHTEQLEEEEEEQNEAGSQPSTMLVNDQQTNVQSISYNEIRIGDVIEYKIPESNVTESSLVLSRAGKIKGGNCFWWNVKVVHSGETKSINTSRMLDLKKVETNENIVDTLVVTVPRYLYNEPECIAAKDVELENWRSFGVYKEVKDEGQDLLNTNWVIVKKGEGVKARLCIRGDQEQEKESVRTDSPTVNKVNVKVFYVIAASKAWTVRTADVKAAFLQGADLERDVYVRPPKERREKGIVWKLIKRAYGLVDASRGFYLELDKVVTELGCKASVFDPALYMYYKEDGSLGGMILTHVDDLLHGSGDDQFQQTVMEPLKKRFLFGREEDNENSNM